MDERTNVIASGGARGLKGTISLAWGAGVGGAGAGLFGDPEVAISFGATVVGEAGAEGLLTLCLPC